MLKEYHLRQAVEDKGEGGREEGGREGGRALTEVWPHA